MSEYTQGQWAYDDLSQTVNTVSDNANTISRTICIITQGNNSDYGAEEDANARLIAAAPDMYELLKYIALTFAHDAGYSDICSMIHKVFARIDNPHTEDKPAKTIKYSSSFFQNKDCEYFPCHATTDTDNFSCLFCFCPLYHMEKCPGSPTYLPSGIKDCSNCQLPHRDYNRIIQELRKENNHG